MKISIRIDRLAMKRILNILEEYLRKYPSPAQITLYENLFKLNYIYSSPFTDSKHTKEIYYPISPINPQSRIGASLTKIAYNDKGRIEETDSFDSVLTKDKHEKVMQDDVFGKAVQNGDGSRWVYIAEVKQQAAKSYFNEGKGKLPYKYDFGETYDDIKDVGIFIWDKNLKKVFKVQIDKSLIPSCPSFANAEGTEIIFHAYSRQNFGHGILHCFNRPVSIYHASLTITKEEKKQGDKPKKQQVKLNAKIQQIIKNEHQTNIFPKLSPCFKYLAYHSGTGITHTYYLDLVIAKKDGQGWTESHRIKDRFVGYYDTLKNYMIVENGQTYVISQTIEKCGTQILKINCQTGEIINLTQGFETYNFSIQDVRQSGLITGVVNTNNFNTFFYNKQGKIEFIEPSSKQNFVEKEYNQPIHALYLEAKEEDLFEDYRGRASKRPLLVIPHGGPHGSFVNMLTSLRYTLLKMGYSLLMPNFSGSAGYGKEHLSGALTNIGEKDADEIIAVMERVFKDHPQIDRTNVHIQGGSYGGYMAAIMGSRYPQYFKSAIVLNGVLNVIANLWFTDIPEWNTVQALGRAQLSELNEKHYIQMFKQSPISTPMKIPTLQFLGAKDRRVPYRQGLLFDAITKDVGTPITTYVYENSAHSLADSVETSFDIIVKTILFLQGIKDEQQSKEKTEEKQ